MLGYWVVILSGDAAISGKYLASVFKYTDEDWELRKGNLVDPVQPVAGPFRTHAQAREAADELEAMVKA